MNCSLTIMITKRSSSTPSTVPSAFCIEQIIDEHFDGKGRKVFDAYGRGTKFILGEIIKLYHVCLKNFREQKNMSIIILAHSQVKNLPEPRRPETMIVGKPVLTKETWAIMDRWVDMILFGKLRDPSPRRRPSRPPKRKRRAAKSARFTPFRHAAYDAGNRYGLPDENRMRRLRQRSLAKLRIRSSTLTARKEWTNGSFLHPRTLIAPRIVKQVLTENRKGNPEFQLTVLPIGYYEKEEYVQYDFPYSRTNLSHAPPREPSAPPTSPAGSWKSLPLSSASTATASSS